MQCVFTLYSVYLQCVPTNPVWVYSVSPQCRVWLHHCANKASSCNTVSLHNMYILNMVSKLCPKTVSLQSVGNCGEFPSACVLCCDFRAGGASFHWAQPHSVIKILFSLTTPFHGSFFTCAKNTQSALAQTRGEDGGEHEPLSERTCKCVNRQELGTYDLT